jgi:hypothetical protein
MLFLATLFESLPGATLGAAVIDAMLGLITFVPAQPSGSCSSGSWPGSSSG